MPTNNAWNSNIPVEISKGGTNATSMATSTGIVKYDGTSLVTSSTALIDSSNRMTNTSQPCFLAYLGSNATNVTGDGTVYRVAFDTEAYDVGSNFTTGASAAFTAPVTGKYLLSVSVRWSVAVFTTNTFNVQIVTTARTYDCQLGYVSGSSNNSTISFSVLADMSATNTAYVNFSCAGGTKTVSALGGASPVLTFFSGHLVC